MSTNQLESTLKNARTIIDEGITYWESPGRESRRQDTHETLFEGEQTIRDVFQEGIIDRERHSDCRATVAAAQLVLAAADYGHRGGNGTLASQYPDDVLERMHTFDDFRQYDVYEEDEDELQRRIQSTDSQLYGLVEKEIAPQLHALNDALTGEHSELDDFQMRGLKSLYSDRLDKLHKAVSIYIRYHGVPNVVDEIEEAVLETAEAANIRNDVVSSVEEAVDELSTSLHQSLRDERRQLEAEIHRAELGDSSFDEDRLDEALNRIDDLLDRQTKQQKRLDEHLDTLSSNASALDEQISQLESQLSSGDLEARIEALINDELEALRTERDRIQRQVDQLTAEREELAAASEALENNRKRTTVPTSGDETEAEAILSTEARIAEFDYTSRFETSVHDYGRVWLPDGNVFEADSEYWSSQHSRIDERQRMRSLLAEYGDDNADKRLGQYPLNRQSRFVVSDSSSLGLRKRERLILDLRVHAHLEMYAEHNADIRPASQEDLLGVVNDAVTTAESADTAYLLTVASPTGWTNNVESTVINGEDVGASFSRLLGIVLVDLADQRLIYDESDDLVTENIKLFTFETPDETVAACAEEIRERFATRDRTSYVTVDTVTAETNFDAYTVSQAFKSLENENVGTREQTKYGLCLYFDDVL